MRNRPKGGREIWKGIKGFKGRYAVSNMGRAGQYGITLTEAADGDKSVAMALSMSWNECMDFIKEHGFQVPAVE